LQQLFAEEGVEANQVLVIDDMENNLAVAQQAGAKTAWIHADANKQNHAWDISAATFTALLET
jgi:putative hydrolase of the HAD superfamily